MKMINLKSLCMYLCVILLLAACGPSPEAAATMTAAAWTATPDPTVTPTPLPYDLTVSLVGEGGESVFYDANMKAPGYYRVKVDEAGAANLTDLPGPDVEVSVTAQGYEPYTETITLNPGENNIELTLTSDPRQVKPSEACDEGQSLLYIEDFEDSEAQGWDKVNSPTWEFQTLDDRGTVLVHSTESTEINRVEYKFENDYTNMVWKMDILNEGDVVFNIHIKGSTLYQIRFQPTGGEGAKLIHFENGKNQLVRERGYNQIGDWNKIAIAFFEGNLEFWIDGELYVEMDDPDPIGPGGNAIQVNPTGTAVVFDNMVICELTEPYAPSAGEVEAAE